MVRRAHLVQYERLGEGEGPASLETPPDHGAGRGGRRGGQAERVLKAQPTHLHAHVHRVYRREELGQAGRPGHLLAVKRLGGGTEHRDQGLEPHTVDIQTSLIRASLIHMPHNPNTVPGNRFYHFLFIMIQ